MISWFALLAALLPFVSAFRHLHARTQSQTICDKFDAVPMGPYSLLTDLWGSSGGDGKQCATVNSVNDDVVNWSTDFSWYATSIMSYSNIQLDDGLNKQLSQISSIPSKWTWALSTEEIVADVTYDFFTSSSPGGNNEFEIMVWLGNFKSGPISYEYDYSGKALPIAKNLDINGHHWDLYYGSNNYNIVYSFLPTNGVIDSWSADMYKFFTYLIQNGLLGATQYLKTAQAGIEATSGTATFETSAYSLAIN